MEGFSRRGFVGSLAAMGAAAWMPRTASAAPKALKVSPIRGGAADEMRANVASFVHNDLTVASRAMNGVNFVAIDNGELNLREDSVERVKAEFAKGMPVVLMCHIPPTYTPTFLKNANDMRRQTLLGQGESEEEIAKLPYPTPIEPRYDARTKAFWEWAREQSALKAVLCGHMHVEERDRFSDTADMYVVGGNYEGFAYEITFG